MAAEKKRSVDAAELTALRTCATICWQRRKELGLAEPEIEHVLIAWMAIGTEEEGTAASALLQARRAVQRRQTNFDEFLNGS